MKYYIMQDPQRVEQSVALSCIHIRAGYTEFEAY